MMRCLLLALCMLMTGGARAQEPLRVVFASSLTADQRPLDELSSFDLDRRIYVWVGWSGLLPKVQHVARISVFAPDDRRMWSGTNSFTPDESYYPTWFWRANGWRIALPMPGCAARKINPDGC